MELKSSLINANPGFAGIRPMPEDGSRTEIGFCESWLLKSDEGATLQGIRLEPNESGKGIVLRLGPGQAPWLGTRIRAQAARRKGVWRVTLRLRGTGGTEARPMLATSYLARRDARGAWSFEVPVFGPSQIGEDWTELVTTLSLERPLLSPKRLATFWSWVRAIASRGARDALLLVFQLSGPGTIEIEEVLVTEERLSPSPPAALPLAKPQPRVSETPSSPGEGIASAAGRSGRKAVPVKRGSVAAILEGRVLGSIAPNPALVHATLRVDGKIVGDITAPDLTGAEVAVLGDRTVDGFAVALPGGLLDGKEHRVGLYDELVDEPVAGTEVGLMLKDGLYLVVRGEA